MQPKNGNCISIGSISTKPITPREFRELPESKTELGILLLSLLEESVWSNELSVSAYFDSKEGVTLGSRITIHGAYIQSNNGEQTITIKTEDEIYTVEEVAELVTNAYETNIQSIWSAMKILQRESQAIHTAKNAIHGTLNDQSARRLIESQMPEVDVKKLLYRPGPPSGWRLYIDCANKRVILIVAVQNSPDRKDIYIRTYEEGKFPEVFTDEVANETVNHAKKLE